MATFAAQKPHLQEAFLPERARGRNGSIDVSGHVFCDTSVGLMDFTSVWKYHVFVDDMLTSLVNSMECLHEGVSVAMFDLPGLSR